MKKTNPKDKLVMFKKHGDLGRPLKEAQLFFKEHVNNVTTKEEAFLWLVSEVGELAESLKTKSEQDLRERYIDDIGDIFMWLFTLSNLLKIDLAEALDFSVDMLVKKGYTNLE